ncbi:hypothetical protein LTR56_011541 [Elasticomyces elasticus]|nr:hypothetical protein LTR56_011541 [Elasticomyces elasticus]KAK3643270.1 hypothetical protein LTR22_015737 [Elasticomyces elasticus]KAK4930260.1 hypothetical protein LTR49_003294 [Elasticomyces elasticus]
MVNEPTLLGLPAELRLAIYEWYLRSRPTYDAFPLTRLQQYTNATAQDQHEVKSYSFLFTHAVVYKEAYILVVHTHPAMFSSLNETLSIPKGLLPYQDRIKSATLDLGICGGDVVRDVLHNLATMPALKELRILLPQTNVHDGLRLPFEWCPSCTYVSLELFEAIDIEISYRQREAQAEVAELTRLESIENEGMPLSREQQASRGRLCIEQLYRDTLARKGQPRRGQVARKRIRILNRKLGDCVDTRRDARWHGWHTCAKADGRTLLEALQGPLVAGLWLTEVAAKYPQAQCVGFDISDKQFPPASDVETNFAKRVQFHALDATAEEGYGAEFEGQFDVVAVRLLHVSIAGAQWTRAVKNAVALLKPCGYLQWLDFDPRSAHVVQSRPLLKRAAIDQLIESFGEFLAATDSGATARLAQEMRESGLVDVQSELFALDVDPGWRKYFLWTMTHVMPDILQARVPKGRAAEEWAELKADAQEEGEQEGLWVRTEIYCHVGQKPE